MARGSDAQAEKNDNTPDSFLLPLFLLCPASAVPITNKASSLLASVSALSAGLEGTGKKVAEVEAACSQDLKDSERRASAKSQTAANAQAKTNQEVRSPRSY